MKKISLFLTLLFLLPFLPVPLSAQNSSPPPGASAEVLGKKVREEAKEKLLKKKAVEEIPIEEEKPVEKVPEGPSFYVSKIRLEGNEVLPDKLLEPLFRPYEGRQISSEDLRELQKKIEDLFRAQGYLAAAYVPQQDIEEGKLTLGIVTSRMGKLRLPKTRYVNPWRLRSYWKIPQGKILRFDEIQKSVLAMNQNPDRAVRSFLKPGAEPSTTDVHLKVEERIPIHASFTLDNEGVKLTGKDRFGLTIRHNNFMGLDDNFQIGTTFGGYFGSLYLNHVIPLTTFGTRFIWGYSYSDVSPKKEFKKDHINGISKTYSLALHQKVLSTDNLMIESHVGFDFKEKTNRQSAEITNWDRLRVLSLGGDVQRLDPWGSWTFSPEFDFGFSPHGNGFALNTRGGEVNFFKTALTLKRIQRLLFGTSANLTLKAQLSPDKLTPQEEFFLGGSATVRGYPESDYGADQAILSRNEFLLSSFSLPKDWNVPAWVLKSGIQPLVFVDQGYGRLRDPSSTEHRSRTFFSVGVGFIFQITQYVSGRVEWGIPLGRHPLTESGKSQLHFKLTTEI